MPDHLHTSTPQKHIRRKGQRPTAAQRIDEQNAFLKAFASSGNVRAACMAAGINRSAVYSWSETDVEFTIRYNQAKEDVNDAIRAEIYRRGSTLFTSMPVTRFVCTRCRLPFIGRTSERCQCKALVRKSRVSA